MANSNDLGEKYFLRLAAAFVRGRFIGSSPEEHLAELRAAELDELSEQELTTLVQYGSDKGLRLHKFKRTMGLTRVSRVLGAIKGFAPASLLDVGSGRGAFLWTVLNEFPNLAVTCIDIREDRVADILAVKAGGVENLNAHIMGADCLGFNANSFDLVTLLEVLEHMSAPEDAIDEALRVASLAVILSVPSHEDDNPEHVHLLGKRELSAMLSKQAGARKYRVVFDQVLNHLIATVTLAKEINT